MKMKVFYVLLASVLCYLLWQQWLVKAQLAQLQQQAASTEQAMAQLYDTQIALQRGIRVEPSSTQKQPLATQNRPTAVLDDAKPGLITELKWVEFALQNQHLVEAMQALSQIKSSLKQRHLPAALAASLEQALVQDVDTLQRWQAQQRQQEQILQSMLNQIYSQLASVKNKPPAVEVGKQAWWKTWLVIEKQSQGSSLDGREARYMDAAWRLQLAQHALLTGKTALYQAQLQQARDSISTVPDVSSQQLLKQINTVLQQPDRSTPRLESLALLSATSP